MKPYAIVDTDKMPIVIVTFTGAHSTDENFQQYLDDLEGCYDDRKTIAIIFDASNAVIPKLSLQRKQAYWISQHWKMIQTYCKGTAYVIPNMAIRTVLKMIFSFQNQPAPYKIFSNIEEAEIWIGDLISKKKVLN
ncbi:STAS/SEC14 domain-containing protein [Marivirga salinae]|uniref:STAS/SEC14 domain-containing protein n=1 Tax=Marivirga salinarum TaxID=3059078 RepID=A0AA51NC51_9BACT|nr:STAS/SEC14 domain-containing protein [Marivirga sp. BDSF4-3]WMN12350.1 STAS/SEC14 domain-containing protein [Marivirga sp. BDSF4-3]